MGTERAEWWLCELHGNPRFAMGVKGTVKKKGQQICKSVDLYQLSKIVY